MKVITTVTQETEIDIQYPAFVKFADKYYKIIGDGNILVVEDWGFSKSIELVPNEHCDPFGNEGWKFISESEFNEAHLRVNEFLNAYLPKTELA